MRHFDFKVACTSHGGVRTFQQRQDEIEKEEPVNLAAVVLPENDNQEDETAVKTGDGVLQSYDLLSNYNKVNIQKVEDGGQLNLSRVFLSDDEIIALGFTKDEIERYFPQVSIAKKVGLLSGSVLCRVFDPISLNGKIFDSPEKLLEYLRKPLINEELPSVSDDINDLLEAFRNGELPLDEIEAKLKELGVVNILIDQTAKYVERDNGNGFVKISKEYEYSLAFEFGGGHYLIKTDNVANQDLKLIIKEAQGGDLTNDKIEQRLIEIGATDVRFENNKVYFSLAGARHYFEL